MGTQTETASVLPLIRTIRGQRVILDSDLAALYGVATKRLNQQVRRNQRRFPADFAFAVTRQEAAAMRLQIATSSAKRNWLRLPTAYTEHGAVMAANVLNSERAVIMSVEVVRAFIRLRRAAVSYELLRRKLQELEREVKAGLFDQNKKIAGILELLRRLIGNAEAPAKRRIGFAAP